LDWSKPHIFVMNHQSMLDIACAFTALPTNLRFVAKSSLKYVPFLGWYMWMTQMIFVDRSNKKRAFKSLVEAGRRIREGASILVYPEGTRSKDGGILPFKTGSFALALEAQVPLVPVAIDGSLRVAPPGSAAFRPGRVRMKVGLPISTENRPRQAREALSREVREALIELHREIGGRSS
jgi:1-acyl-sn-glycerol-3-phosphate acyltransferase